MKNEQATSSGLGFGAVLFIVFLVLKLTNVIDWSWWWVTAPLWIPIGLAVMIFIVTALVIIVKAIKRKKQ
jgi:ABC-type Fe3+-siderophore transport system permease subunit